MSGILRVEEKARETRLARTGLGWTKWKILLPSEGLLANSRSTWEAASSGIQLTTYRHEGLTESVPDRKGWKEATNFAVIEIGEEP